MVEVAHSVPVCSGIIVAAELYALLICLFLGLTAIIVGADIGRFHLVGYSLVGFYREVKPGGYVLAMVDYYVGDGSDAVILEGLDERAEFAFTSERTFVVGKPVEVVVTH